MRVIEPGILCKGFLICIGYVSPGDEIVITKEEMRKEGGFSQLGYTPMGEATLYDIDDNVLYRFKDNEFYDLRDFYRSNGLKYKSESGGAWFGINPIPSNKIFNGRLLKENEVIEGDGIERVVVCVKGHFFANESKLDYKQYVRITKDKVVNIEIPEGSIALYFEDSGLAQR